jgi:hypothetical protein
MAPPAKKAKKSQRVVPKKARKVVESNDNDEDAALLTKMGSLLGNIDPLEFD